MSEINEKLDSIKESINNLTEAVKENTNEIKREFDIDTNTAKVQQLPNGVAVQVPPGTDINQVIGNIMGVQPQQQPQQDVKMEKVEIPIYTPKELKAYLDEHIIGQDEAKIRISTAMYKHYMRLAQVDNDNPVQIEKSNVMIIGASGCGKTEIARQLAKKMGLPFTIFDVSSVSAAGYVGNDLVFCLRDLIDEAHGNMKLAERGIVFIDEFNKIARSSGANRSITADVNGERVQGELLRMIEDGTVDVPTDRGRLNPQQPMVKMDCSNVLFIFSGAFEGLDKIIEKRLACKQVGYNAKSIQEQLDMDDILKYTTTEDLLNYGIMRELLSRTPIITHVKNLTPGQLTQILTEPKNAIVKQYQKLFNMCGKVLQFEPEALNYIAELAEKKHTGARALRFMIDKVVDDFIYDIDGPTGTVIITKDIAQQKLQVA